MGTKLVLGLWSLLCVVSLASSKAVVSCKDKGICRDLRIITANSNEIPSGLTQYRQSAESIDLHGNLMERYNLCCIQSSAPYADRVIRYNKRQHEALQNSSTIQQHGPNCANYKPSPCDGDDNKVYEVANMAANDIQSLVAQDKEALQGILNQQRTLLETKQTEKDRIDNENNQLQTTLNDLTGYIGKLYQDDGFKVPANPAEQLKQIFTKRDGDNKATLEQVNEEERKLQNLQTDIARIEEELQDLGDRKERLLGDINARNATVVEHEKKIKELQEKIDKRG
ncbi:hypothetical protein pipiens_010236 [Culex pipiens pipiens]|uniref:Uncharacterized protein n=1 Tax=Culex pipiens pipiens TaxID=38569 RepID=A0ABD1DAY6_CULPP